MKRFNFIIFFLVFFPFFVIGQIREDGLWKGASSNQFPLDLDLGRVVELDLPFRNTNPQKTRIWFSKLFLKASTGDVHDFGDKPFDAYLSFKMEGITSDGLVVSDLTSWFCGGSTLDVHLSQKSTAQSFSKSETSDFTLFTLNSGGGSVENFYSIRRIRVTLISAPNVVTSGTFGDHIRQVLKISLGYEIGARFDLSGVVVQPDGPTWAPSQRVLERTKYASFKWKITANPDNVPVDQFELEVLRLRNVVERNSSSDVNRENCSCNQLTSQGMFEEQDFNTGRLIFARINWSEALHYRVGKGSLVKDLFLSEGSGFYIWRVRALGDFEGSDFQVPQFHSAWTFKDKGDFFDGNPLVVSPSQLRFPYPWECQVLAFGNTWIDLGLIKIHVNDLKANSSFSVFKFTGHVDNSYSPLNIIIPSIIPAGSQISGYQTRIKEGAPLFYFSDPDSLLNRNFSRIFSDDNRTKEVEQFANGLDQVRQVQTFLPSARSIVAVGTYFDFSGRSALETLPRVSFGQSRLSGFIPSFMLPNSNNDDRPY
jgi:hypothetical protein